MKSRTILIVAGALIIIALISSHILKNNGAQNTANQEVAVVGIVGEPRDIVVEYYLDWRDALASTSTTPAEQGLDEKAHLSAQARAYLKEAAKADAIDPLLCQVDIPAKLATKSIHAAGNQETFLVTGRTADKSVLPGQSVVTVTNTDSGWVIDTIECDLSGMQIEREFTFERDGFLLKNVPEPLDSEHWHLVFSENNRMGHTAPLFFSESSTCTDTTGNVVICDESTLNEAAEVFIQGNMTELGVDVSAITFK